MQLIGETTNRSNPLPLPVEMRAPLHGRSLRNAPPLGTHATAYLGTGFGQRKKNSVEVGLGLSVNLRAQLQSNIHANLFFT